MIDEKHLIQIGPFVKGVNNMADEASLGPDELREALNIDIDQSGGASSREGYSEVVTGTNTHSLVSWGGALLFVEDGTITRFDPVSSVKTVIVTGLNPNRYVSYQRVRNELFWANGEQSGRLSKVFGNTPWAVPNPPVQPTLAALGSGSMPAGKYQIAITYVDSHGEESGTGLAAEISCSGGISLSGIPAPGSGYFVRIYATPPNGDQFFEQAQLPNGVSTYSLYVFSDQGMTLETQHTRPIPPGQIVRHGFGRLWVARDNVLMFSCPVSPGIYRPMDDYLMFRKRITVLEPIADGIWLCTPDETFFIQGPSPEQMAVQLVSRHGGLEGTGMPLDAAKFGAALGGISGRVAYWFGDNGASIGLPQGQVRSFMEGRVAVDQYSRGASVLREENGMQQVITTVRDKTMENRVRVTDEAVGYVRRNGIIIQ